MITQKIFVVLVVLTQSFKLVSFFTFMMISDNDYVGYIVL